VLEAYLGREAEQAEAAVQEGARGA
jgi:hypothetical protein